MSIQDVSNLLQDTNILAHLSKQPQAQLSLQVGLGFGSLLRLAVRTSRRHHGPMSIPMRRRLEIKIQSMISVTTTRQDQTDGENEERDGVQDQEQTLETGDTMDFRQHKDDLDGEYEGEAQEDFNRCDFDHEPDTVDDFLNQGIDGDFDDELDTQRDKPDAQDNAIDDDFNNELDNAARDKTEESEAFDVLERHQMKNGRRKAPSLTYLSKAKHTECRHASSHSKSPRRPSPRHVVSTGSSALARPPKSCPVYAPYFLLHALSPFYTLKVSISAFGIASRSTSPSHATCDEPDSRRNKRKAKTAQEDPVKLSFYPPAWQAFLQYVTQMSRLLCDDLFAFRTELKKVVISVTKASYDIFLKGTIARKDEYYSDLRAPLCHILWTEDGVFDPVEPIHVVIINSDVWMETLIVLNSTVFPST
ncbi:uncharacterized protein HD556DRAFT_1302714 [Suillus plorans]|uniref:Uncharacterized protein n=1 Tax=Suillus plorans TaxID=116603 RepID=A0A9P7J9Z7_9AGAM|nr:uncharacterized protein HD556DRAFT_1302714 [Suillus plorans]KAG1810408.1 hypothetical protein HD556DRAFT_1302714 [Suillus plorans]